MTNLERMRKAANGELSDRLAFVPRLDLWYTPNKMRGTLPPEHKNRTIDEIARAEGWGFRKIQKALFDGDEKAIQNLVKMALQAGEKADAILHQGLIPAMGYVGERFKNNEVFIPEVCYPQGR